MAVVRDGAVAYVHAYGLATIEPPMPATPEMRYSIGSISKQFTAAAILLLAEDRKLSLDDRVAKWLPDLTRANEVTIRQLLSMTSGYQDFWPQDYVMPPMMLPTTAQQIMDGWAKMPLDFEPGTKWQYSNTNYVIAGAIVERVSGMPLVDFLQKRVFTPLGMKSVVNTDDAALGPGDPMRYLRYAVGPPRQAPKEGKGWMFAAGELAMTARDLALWDISTIEQTILRPASYQAMQTNTLLKNGVATGYGLGVQVGQSAGRRRRVAYGRGVRLHGGESDLSGRQGGRRRAHQSRRDGRFVAAGGPDCDPAVPRHVAGYRRGRGARAGEGGVRRPAARTDRPRPLHRQRQRVFHRCRARGLRIRTRAAGAAAGVRAGQSVAAWRHGGALLPNQVRRENAAPDHVHDAGRQARAVSDRSD